LWQAFSSYASGLPIAAVFNAFAQLQRFDRSEREILLLAKQAHDSNGRNANGKCSLCGRRIAAKVLKNPLLVLATVVLSIYRP
jgi:hypothetical protein